MMLNILFFNGGCEYSPGDIVLAPDGIMYMAKNECKPNSANFQDNFVKVINNHEERQGVLSDVVEGNELAVNAFLDCVIDTLRSKYAIYAQTIRDVKAGILNIMPYATNDEVTDAFYHRSYIIDRYHRRALTRCKEIFGTEYTNALSKEERVFVLSYRTIGFERMPELEDSFVNYDGVCDELEVIRRSVFDLYMNLYGEVSGRTLFEEKYNEIRDGETI